MKVNRLSVGVLGVNCYLVLDEETYETAVIDPGGDENTIIKALDKIKAKVKYILLTHGHYDHTGAAVFLKNKYEVPLYINKKDYEMIQSDTGELFYMHDDDGTLNTFLDEKSEFYLGNNKIFCLETPGHSPGGMTFLMGDIAFTGDSLFAGSIGRTDFVGGDYGTLMKSVETKLTTLPENTIILPGHGPESTIQEEKESNPFLV
ncbi:MBL fold metallo-hydrolase [Clostridium sp. 19966]|uniref:MBL fold metallo-hydrolase n=1 Tax=Clostridium sp. 19966 TaxID=2768166 RepID=UPI0028DF7917|nr:MBL fold metallo-hydrolase [Clostridium sp. 19966]MDT8716246.1 MBL fold metallo-hydrolase [Clostridium sp. 19966]